MDERQEFEAWFRKFAERDAPTQAAFNRTVDRYDWEFMQGMWDAWQARAAFCPSDSSVIIYKPLGMSSAEIAKLADEARNMTPTGPNWHRNFAEALIDVLDRNRSSNGENNG